VSNKSMIVLVYKEVYFNTKEFDSCIPCVVVYFLYEFDDVFLSGLPPTFIRLMNHMLRAFIGKFLVVYFDNIMIYRKSLNKHVEHLRNVLDVLLN